ncbi:phage head-binding domain-containing protein [Proteus vulgaris]|uniref:phage head-binding domain-containing protein n=1 Tax=Proteus vulgaris TaxID=585 RepID=UPI002874CFCB|nr:phage head-binding domain-containing protein [Proteus vulgaris]MDS0789133.1 phage head-binding domain-containing protein [Proteus vulgaris]
MIPSVVVSMPSQLFTLARKFQAANNGKIFIGKIDSDPTIPENQIQVYLENEDGSHIPVPQPLIINQAGFPVYNGQIAKFVTVEGHSMAVYDSYGSQQHYYPNVLKYDPDQFSQKLSSNDGASLIGTKSGKTVQDEIDLIAGNSGDNYKFINDLKSTDNDKNLQLIPTSDNDESINNLGLAISNQGDKLSAAYLNSKRAGKDGIFLTPDELGHRVGRIMYSARSGNGELLTDLTTYYPKHYNYSSSKSLRDGINCRFVSKNGLDTNNGKSWDNAYASFNKALLDEPDVIYVDDGLYDINNSPSSMLLNKNISIICEEGEAVFTRARAVDWTRAQGNTYKSTRAGGTPIGVVDFRHIDEFGDNPFFTKVQTEDEVISTPFSFTVEGSGSASVVIANFNGLTPDNANSLVIRSAPFMINMQSNDITVYMKNIKWFAGDDGGLTVRYGTDKSVFIAENCKFKNAYKFNCLRVQGVGLSITKNCEASLSLEQDCFNYHSLENTKGVMVDTHFIEINCSAWAGNKGGTGNATTSHDDCVGFRINGNYGYCRGPGVADVHRAKTFNVCCSSNFNYADKNSGGFVAGDGTPVMWLHNCIAYGNRAAGFSAESSSKMYLLGSDSDTYSSTDDGVFIEYKPVF